MRVSRAASVVGALLVLGSVPSSPSEAQTEPEFVGYSAMATGTAFTSFPSVPALLPVDVPVEATVSLATATLSSGGQGFGQASTFFPGTPIVGIRPLVEVASGQRLPIPDYPIIVESREFEPAKHNEQPGMTMSSDVDPDRAVAIADVGGMVIPAVLGVRSSRTVSTSLLEPASVSATSVSTLNGVDIAGVVRIESLSSVASVTSDATTAVCDGGVTVTGVTVNGQPATIDEDGLHLQDQDLVPGLGLDDVLDPVLEASGIEIRTLGGSGACEGSTGNRSTAGLLVSIPLPAVGAIPPGGHFDIVLASTSAAAGASTLPELVAPPFDPPPVVGDVVSRSPGPLAGGVALPPVSSPPVPTPPSVSIDSPLAADDVAYSFAGVPAPLLIGLALLALPAARRLRRYMERIFTLVAPT